MPDLGRYKINWSIDELRAYLGEGEILCEAAFALDHDGCAEFLGENIGRAYPNDGRICGAADILVKRPHALLVDVKSGTYPVPEAAENWQLAALALMAYDWFHFETVTGVIVHMERGGTWRFGEPHTWDNKQLLTIHHRISHKRRKWHEAQLLHDAGFAPPTKTQGAHCFFCRARCEFGRNRESEAA